MKGSISFKNSFTVFKFSITTEAVLSENPFIAIIFSRETLSLNKPGKCSSNVSIFFSPIPLPNKPLAAIKHDKLTSFIALFMFL